MTQIISLPLRCTKSRMEKWSSSLKLHGFAPSSQCLCRCRVTTPTAPSAPCSYSEPSLTTLRVQSTLLGRKHGLLDSFCVSAQILSNFVFLWGYFFTSFAISLTVSRESLMHFTDLIASATAKFSAWFVLVLVCLTLLCIILIPCITLC